VPQSKIIFVFCQEFLPIATYKFAAIRMSSGQAGGLAFKKGEAGLEPASDRKGVERGGRDRKNCFSRRRVNLRVVTTSCSNATIRPDPVPRSGRYSTIHSDKEDSDANCRLDGDTSRIFRDPYVARRSLL